MTSALGTVGLFILAATTIAAVGTARSEAQQSQKDRGQQILSRSCLGCHDSRPVDTSAYDADGWTQVVNAEIKKGAKVEKDDLPILIDYLAKMHGPLPDGPGKEILLNTCTLCHDLSRVRQHRVTAEEWAGTLESMLNEGAPLPEDQFPVILLYLARNFGPLD
jgi:cytochrome c5